MAEAKMIFKWFYGILFVGYGYNLFDVIVDSLTESRPQDLFSESAQTGFAVLGMIVFVVKIVDKVIQIDHKRKMNKLERKSKSQEIQYFKELNEIKSSPNKKNKK